MHWCPSQGSHKTAAGLRTARFLIDECGANLETGNEKGESTISAILREDIPRAIAFLLKLGVPEKELIGRTEVSTAAS